MIRQPKNVQWRAIRYTDPEVALTQSDEDKILGQNPPAEDDPNGKFTAVQVEFELAASVYATMALREVTREETSTWHHAGLTLSGEDQEFRGSKKKEGEDGAAEAEEDKAEGGKAEEDEDVKEDEKMEEGAEEAKVA
jgi:tRNA pseudouridine13 synthase